MSHVGCKPMPTIIEGVASDRIYLIRYDEDQWERYDDAGKQFCYDTWIKKATPLAVDTVVLQLIPDPIFPRGSHEKPYVGWQHWIERKADKGFVITGIATVWLPKGVNELDVPLRAKIEREVYEKYPNGTTYVILGGNSHQLVQGKVQK